MKQVDAVLNDYMNAEKHFESNDLFLLQLADGATYYITNSDNDVEWSGHTWSRDLFIIAREQVKLQGAPAVDTLSVNIKCNETDKINGVPFMAACHNGLLDGATLALYKVYFRDGECLGAYKMFEGITEVSQAGGISVRLSVKSVVQGLSQSVPVRIFAPQTAYTANASGVVVSSSTDSYTMLIPLKPSQNVLSRI